MNIKKKILRFTYHDKQTIHSSRILISYFYLSQKLKALNPVSCNNPFHPLLRGWWGGHLGFTVLRYCGNFNFNVRYCSIL